MAMSTATETEKLRSSIHLPFSAIKFKQKLGRRTKTTGEGNPPEKKKRGEGENKSWRNSSSNICPSTQVHSQYLLNPDALRRCSMIVYNQANHVEHKTGSLKRSTKENIVENKCTGKAHQHYVPLSSALLLKILKSSKLQSV